MKLLGTHRSPYVRKVRIVLEEKRIPYDFVIAPPTDPKSGVSKHNPLGKIPVLVCDDGNSIYDSSVIVEYLDGIGRSPNLIPDGFEDRIQVKRWQALGDGIVDSAVLISRNQRQPMATRQSVEWHSNQQAKVDAGMATMERDLGSQHFCFANTFTLADVTCGMALGYLDRVMPDLRWRNAYPRLGRHFERLGERASFKNTLPPP
jgi:glutathione S-transferase